MKTDDIGIVILAAGASTRFGSPKQLAEFEGKTLIERITDTAVSTGFRTVVVLGSSAEEIRPVIADRKVGIAINEDWEIGMSSSIRTGLEKLLEVNRDFSAVILLLCDQPLITKETILSLVSAYENSKKPIVASAYADTLGTPALFESKLFGELLRLEGDRGAKLLIAQCSKSSLATIDAPEAETDIDRRDDIKDWPC